jgi:dephospho-CoA kinase
MVEAGWHKRCDKIIFVDAPRELRLARLKESRGWAEQELERRESMQLNLDEKKLHAHAVIVNDGDTEKVACQLKDALERWRMIC